MLAEALSFINTGSQSPLEVSWIPAAPRIKAEPPATTPGLTGAGTNQRFSKKVKPRHHPAEQAIGDRKHTQPEAATHVCRVSECWVPQWLSTGPRAGEGPQASQFILFFFFFNFCQEAEKNNAEGLLHNQAGRTKDGSFTPSHDHRAHEALRWTLRALCRHPSSRLKANQEEQARTGAGGRKRKSKPKPRKIRVYKYVHKKSGFRRSFARK